MTTGLAENHTRNIANKAIEAALSVAGHSDSNDQEISLLNSYFTSVLTLLPQEQFIPLVHLMAEEIDVEIAHAPNEIQQEHVDQLTDLIEQLRQE